MPSFSAAPLLPRTTRLPVTVFVAPTLSIALIEPMIWVGDNADLAIPVLIRPPIMIRGELPSEVVAAITAWVEANSEAIADYWVGSIDVIELVARLKRA